MSYDRIPEETTFLRELRGYPKDRMRLRGLVQWCRRMLRGEVQLGRLHVACGAPLLLSPDADPHTFSRQVMEQLQEQTVITDYHLRYFLRAQQQQRDGDRFDLDWLRAAIESRGCRVLDSAAPMPSAGSVDPVMERTLRNQWAHLFVAGAARRRPDNLALAHYAGVTAFAAAKPAAAVDVEEEPLGRLEEALFATVCHDYQALAHAARRALGRAAAQLPVDELLRQSGFHDFTTVSHALEALLEADLLRRIDRQHVQPSGSAADLHRYAQLCAWTPAVATHRPAQRLWPRAVHG